MQDIDSLVRNKWNCNWLEKEAFNNKQVLFFTISTGSAVALAYIQ